MLLSGLLLWVSTGCYIPISQNTKGFRDFFPASREDFTPGLTTRAEVLLEMGEPDERLADDRQLIYRWSEDKGVVTITGCDEYTIRETISFQFTFDAGGILKSLEISYDE